MLKIPRVLAAYKRHISDPLDDFWDRLSSGLSVTILLVFCGISASRLYVGNQLECMSPAHYPGTWHSYLINYCYVENHFSVPFVANETTGEMSSRKQINYYPWVPFFMFLQAAAFCFPRMFWHFMACRFGIDLKSVLREAKSLSKKTVDQRVEKIRELATYMIAYLDFTYENRSTSRFVFASPTALCYLATKWLHFSVAVGQFYVLNEFIGSGNAYWGFDALRMSMNRSGLEEFSPVFPLVTTCTLPSVTDASISTRSFRCLLGMNVVYEKLYIFLYFWLIVMSVITLGSAIYATSLLCMNKMRAKYVNDNLKFTGFDYLRNQSTYNFLQCVLRADGFVAVVLIQKAYGSALTEQILRELWVASENRSRKFAQHNPAANKSNLYETFSKSFAHHLDQSDVPLVRFTPVKQKVVPV